MSTSTPILSVEDIRRRQREMEDIHEDLKALEAEYQSKKAHLNERLGKTNRWLEAVRVILAAEGQEALSERIVPPAVTPDPGSIPTKKSLTEAILDLPDWENGRTSGDVIAALKKLPDVSHISKLGKQVYTNLNRLVEREKLTKSGNKYFLAPEQNEPSDGESDGSKSGPVNGSDPSLDFNPARGVH